MSGVYIKGMKMPKNCLDCKVHYVWSSGRPQCEITGEFIDDRNAYKQKRLDSCPLTPVPPHGRLIDADAIKFSPSVFWGFQATDNAKSAEAIVNDAPIIIPADKEEEM